VTATAMWINGIQLSYQYDRYHATLVSGAGCNWQLSVWLYAPSGPAPGSTATFYYGYM
jgi:hypothetical protein